jgi:hypothetical protein
VKIFRVARWLIFAALGAAVLLMLGNPAPISPPMSRADRAGQADSFFRKMSELRARRTGDEAGVVVRFTSAEVEAALQQRGMTPPSGDEGAAPADDGNAPAASAYRIGFDGDVARGQFQADARVKQVTLTIGGHVGARDGYVTIDPTEFRIGRLRIPVSLLRGALEQRLREQREALRLPDYVSDVRVEQGRLVIRGK